MLFRRELVDLNTPEGDELMDIIAPCILGGEEIEKKTWGRKQRKKVINLVWPKRDHVQETVIYT
jgi:hypothetical protein